MKNLVLLLCLITGLIGCSSHKGDPARLSDPLLFCKTVKRLNDVVLYNNFPPMIASRNYVYANIAAYECIAAGDSSFKSLAGQIRHLPTLPRPAGPVHYDLAALLSFVKVGNAVTFPEGVLMGYYDDLLDSARANGIEPAVIQNTITYSNAVSDVILKWSKGDHYAQTRTAAKFNLSREEGRWVPTPPAYTQGLEPHWCEIRPMILDSAGLFSVPPPPRYNMKDTASAYYRQAAEVKRTVEGLTPEQKHIADFFDDNPFRLEVRGHVMMATKKFSPPGHWMNIVGIAAEKSRSDFHTTVAAYTATAIALFDGFIACWKTKYDAPCIRPETVITKHIDPEWRPYIQTPPFPSYVSGHSVISAAAAETMTHFFGDHFSYRDTSLNEFGIAPRSFNSFRDASLEASWSRLYGGIHFRADLEEGNILGRKIGTYILKRTEFRQAKNALAKKE